MESLAQRPRFLAALMILMAVNTAAMTIAFRRGVVEHGIRTTIESSSRFDEIPAAQREQILERAIRFGSYSAMAAATVGPLAGLLVTSGFLLPVTNVILGARVRFRQLMAVVAHAWLPAAVGGLASIPVLLAKEPEFIDFRNPVPLANLGFLFSPIEQRRLYMAASSLDLFSLWVIGLLTLGLARLTGRSKGLMLGIILIPWALYVVIFKVVPG
jgi:hypothetical protein